MARARLALKSVALSPVPFGVSAMMLSASRREKESRVNPERASEKFIVLIARVNSEYFASAAGAAGVFPEEFPFLADARRGSLASKTGSARTATDLAARCRPAISRRMVDKTEAEGMLTTSCFAIKGS